MEQCTLLEELLENAERVHELRKSPKGGYKVLGIDKFDGTDWVEGIYNTVEEALSIARTRTSEASSLATDSSIATVFYAYDPQGNYIGGDTWNGE